MEPYGRLVRRNVMRRFPLVLVILLLAAACGTERAPELSAPATPSPESSPEVGCDGEPLPPRRASIVALDPDGQERFRRPLPRPDDSSQAPPVEDADHVYLVADGAARALDRETGEQRWERPVQGPLYGMWLDQGLLVMVLDQVVGQAHAVGLEPATGEQRWRYDVPERGLLGEQVLTGEGGLAWITGGGQTQVLDLASGQLSWTAAGPSQDAALAAAGGLVLRGVGRGLTAYDARTGDVRWERSELTDSLVLDVVKEVIIVSQGAIGLGFDGSVDAVELATGRPLWEVKEDEPLGVGGAGPAGVVLYTQSSGAPTYRLVDLATGQTRWTSRTQIALNLPALVGAEHVVTVEGGTSIQPRTALVARRTADGSTAWQIGLESASTPPLQLGGDAVLVLTSAAMESVARIVDAGTGDAVGEVPLEGFVSRPSSSGSGALLQVADPMRACTAGGFGGRATTAATPSMPPAQ